MNYHTLDDRINAYLDGELSLTEQENLLDEVDADPAAKAEFECANTLRSTLRSFDGSVAPPDLTSAVLTAARRTSTRTERPPRERSTRSRGVRHLASSLAAAAMLVIAVLLIVPAPAPDPAESYSEQDVAQALEDIQMAFSIVSEVGERTGRIVRDEALMGRTIEPVRNALKGVVGPQETQL